MQPVERGHCPVWMSLSSALTALQTSVQFATNGCNEPLMADATRYTKDRLFCFAQVKNQLF